MTRGWNPFTWRRGRPLEPGERGSILFLGAFNGGIGGIERLTRTFGAWAETSGFAVTMLFRHILGPGPFTVAETEHVRVLPLGAWSTALADAPWDFVYVMPAALDKSTWIPRVQGLHGTKIGLELDHASPWLEVFDLLHAEAPRDHGFSIPCVVATPDPVLTMPPSVRKDAGDDTPPGGAPNPADYALTVFTPYGPEKGHARIPAFLEGTELDLVWCYDLASFASRSRRWRRAIQSNVESVAQARLRAIESPSQARIYELYRGASGYVCFSQREGLGWAVLDALALEKPICADAVGICRALDGFEATTDFARPVFGRYEMPRTAGFEGLFTAAEAMRDGHAI